MVRTLFGANSYSVEIVAVNESGLGTVLANPTDMIPSDAFDYFIQALGYFRFRIQEMDVRSIEIQVTFADIAGTKRIIETCEITRD